MIRRCLTSFLVRGMGFRSLDDSAYVSLLFFVVLYLILYL
jgi:hypothetical protein